MHDITFTAKGMNNPLKYDNELSFASWLPVQMPMAVSISSFDDELLSHLHTLPTHQGPTKHHRPGPAVPRRSLDNTGIGTVTALAAAPGPTRPEVQGESRPVPTMCVHRISAWLVVYFFLIPFESVVSIDAGTAVPHSKDQAVRGEL